MNTLLPNDIILTWVRGNARPILKFLLLSLAIGSVSWFTSFGIYHDTILYSDDWVQIIESPIIRHVSWLNPHLSRPLIYLPFLVQYHLLGVNISGYYLFLSVISAINASLLYVILNQISILRRYQFSLAITLLYVLYPTDYTRMWLDRIIYSTANTFFLGFGYLLLRFAKGKNWLNLFIALIFGGISLCVYEGAWGLICAWPFLLVCIFNSQLANKRKLALALPDLLAIGFMVWRTLGQKSMGIDVYGLTQLTIDPRDLSSRMFLGYKISLGLGWATAIQNLIPWLSGNFKALTFLAIVVLVLWLILQRIPYRFLTFLTPRITNNEPLGRWQSLKPYVALSVLGLAFIGLGYIPVIAVYLPNLADNASRFNYFAIYGSAIFLGSILMIGAQLFKRFQTQIPLIFWASSSVFLLLSVVTEASIQKDHVMAWQEQKSIWNQLQTIAPNFKANTMILLILPGYQDHFEFQSWQRPPLAADWDASSAVRVLYGNQTLSAGVVYSDVSLPTKPNFTDAGIKSAESPGTVLYDQVVAFVFDSGKLKKLDALPSGFIEGYDSPTDLCMDCILDQNSSGPLRALFQ